MTITNSTPNSTIFDTEEMPASWGEAFHPLEGQDSVTILSLTLPPKIQGTDGFVVKQAPVRPQKEAFFHICLDVSGSMAGSGLRCAKEAMQRLIDHLKTNCGVPPERITVYLFSHVCTVRQLGARDDDQWIKNIKATGGTSFACVFREIIKTSRNHRRQIGRASVDMDATLFFLTDGEDGDASSLKAAKVELETLLKHTPHFESTVHSFGFTAGHDAKLLSWITSAGSESGCFQYIKESGDIASSMSTTLELVGNSAMVAKRKIEIRLQDDGEWIPLKLNADGLSGSTVIRDKVFSSELVEWREYQESGSGSEVPRWLPIQWLAEDNIRRTLAMTTFIQHDLLRMVEEINTMSDIGQSSKRDQMRKMDEVTESYTKSLGTMAFAAARLKEKQAREECMMACQQTRSLLQSFLAIKADAHKQGSISNTSLATFNALAYGQITEAKLKAKLDSRAGKNTSLFADMDEQVTNIVKGLDLDTMESQVSDDLKRELSCAFSTNSFIDALRDGDCLCMTLDVSRSAGAIADPSQLVIKSIFPTYLTSSMFTMALGHSLSQNAPEDVHGGFDRNSIASIAPGLAHENITAVMPLYINDAHWQVAKLRMKPILGYVVTLDATGYTYSQSTTVPFLILAKALESSPMTEFKRRQSKLILDTCDAIYRGSQTLRATTKNMVEQYCASHIHRTVDVIINNYVFLGHIICALRAGDITAAEMDVLLPQFEVSVVEEQIRREMSWRVSDDLMGSVLEWFNIDKQRDVVIPGRQYKEQHDLYVKGVEKSGADAGVENSYRVLFDKARQAQFPGSASSSALATAVKSLSVSDVPLTSPVFELPLFDPASWQLSERSLERLSSIQNAVSEGVDKILRLLTIVKSPLDGDLEHALNVQLGSIAPQKLAEQFFARYSTKSNLATLLQSYAHTKNADRRSAERLMSPFQRRITEGPDAVSDDALQYLSALYQAKMSLMIGQIVSDVEEEYLESRKNIASSLFNTTTDLAVAAGLLLETETRGSFGGKLVTACALRRMTLPRPKIQMLLAGTYKGVRLFTDKTGSLEDIRWYPCKRTLYRMFKHHHDEFSLSEWRKFHPDRYDNYFACRYVIDNLLAELPEHEQVEVLQVYEGRHGRAKA